MEGDMPCDKDPPSEVVDLKARAMAIAATFAMVELAIMLKDSIDSMVLRGNLEKLESRMHANNFELGAAAVREIREMMRSGLHGS